MERRRTDECVVDRLRAEARPTTKELGLLRPKGTGSLCIR